MAALVQGYPQQSGTVTMLQTRPSSASGMLQTVQVQPSGQYKSGAPQRNSIHGLPAAVTAPVVYRGGSGPVQPYAFTSTPSLNPTTQWQQARTQRTSSSPAVPTVQALDYLQSGAGRSRYSASVSMTNLPSTASSNVFIGVGSRDDSALPVPGAARNTSTPRSQQAVASATPTRAAPERYRRSALRANDSAGPSPGQPQQATTASSGMTANSARAAADQKSASLSRPPNPTTLVRPNSFVSSPSGFLVDDMGLPRTQSQDEIKRVRRRSMPAWDAPGFSLHLTPQGLEVPELSIRPKSANDRDNKPLKAGSFSTFDKSGKDVQSGCNLRPASVSFLFFPALSNQAFAPLPAVQFLQVSPTARQPHDQPICPHQRPHRLACSST